MVLMPRSLGTFTCITIALQLTASISNAAADRVKILSGGPAVVAMLMPQKPNLEKAAGVPVEFNVTPVDAAMSALFQGMVDGVLIATEPAGFIDELLKKKDSKEKSDQYQWNEVAAATILLGVNPTNPTSALSNEQITGILSGTIKMWEPINGQKHPVRLVIAKSYSLRAQAAIKHYLGKEESPVSTFVSDKDGLLRALEKEPGAIGIFAGKDKSETFTPKFIPTEATFPLYIVMKKKASAPAQKAFDYLKTVPKGKI